MELPAVESRFCPSSRPLRWSSFLAPSAISGLIAHLALAKTLYRLDYLAFIANNPAVRIRRQAAKAV
jgi:hypothetical protein